VQLSFGGEGDYNTFFKNSLSATILRPAVEPHVVAEKLVEFINEHHMDGIDFDLEINFDSDYLVELIEELKQQKKDICITSAPQVNEGYGKLYFISHNHDQIFNAAIEKGYFDYIFAQLYNTAHYKIPGTNFDQKDPEFISAFFDYAIANNLFPVGTLLVTGEPAGKDGGGVGTIYYDRQEKPQPINAQEVWDKVEEQIEILKGKPGFGGVMTWSIDVDKAENWGFSKTVFKAFDAQNATGKHL